jgi:hypothetical protein
MCNAVEGGTEESIYGCILPLGGYREIARTLICRKWKPGATVSVLLSREKEKA